MRRIRTASTVLALVLWAALPALAQRNLYVRTALAHATPAAYYEAHALPADYGSAVAVTFRLPYSRLVFVRSADGPAFTADAHVTVSLYRDGALIDERAWRTRVDAVTFEATQSGTTDVEGHVSFAVAPGRYAYRIRLGDTPLTPRVPPFVEAPDYASLSLGDALVAAQLSLASDRLTLTAANIGGNVPFGRAAHVVVPVSIPADVDPAAVRLQYHLLRLKDEDVARERKRRADVFGAHTPVPGRENDVFDPGWFVQFGEPVRSGELDAAALFAVRWGDLRGAAERVLYRTTPDSAHGYVALLDLDGVRLQEGTYSLVVSLHAGRKQTLRRTRFNVYWRGKPVGLRDPDLALQLLSFVENEEALRTMQRGRKLQRAERLHTYWAERDPTPDTAFNELMAEYYRRIDHAALRFRSGGASVPDGLGSDRAQVYVLQGPPYEIEREFPDRGGVREVWLYPDGRTFVFEALSAFDSFDLVASGS